jgi:hypothetical protein
MSVLVATATWMKEPVRLACRHGRRQRYRARGAEGFREEVKDHADDAFIALLPPEKRPASEVVVRPRVETEDKTPPSRRTG